MPPKMPKKLSAKEKAAEIKKKNTALAKNIVATLMDESRKSSQADDGSSIGTASKILSQNGISSTAKIVTTRKNNSSKKVNQRVLNENSVENVIPKKAKILKPSATATLSKSSLESSLTGSSSNGTDQILEPIISDNDSVNVTSDIVKNAKPKAESKRKNSEDDANVKFKRIARGTNDVQKVTSSLNSDTLHTATFMFKPTQSEHNPGSDGRPTKSYAYDIDCSRVSNHVKATDLQKYLQKELKFEGVKNNLGENISIDCQGQKVVIKSKVYLPKRSLRFLSKKFLKKNWNIQVLSKNARTYEFKYVGSL